ncbi:hypothetical protein GFK91_24440 [Roseibium aggregatum]|uniref:hypothetical protein n=1 Tax=Roseibium aggregatum TaxID=187304 RepID=UPI001E4E57E5|nr:hypothetical protein [Roseibium aggregatum]UES58500.1 hypothetical protein GFK91_24440 [Roseibium aggregatum]
MTDTATINLPAASSADEILANKTSDGVNDVVRLSVSDLAVQLLPTLSEGIGEATISRINDTLSKAAAYTVTTSDDNAVIKADASSGDVSITLLPAATAGDKFRTIVKKVDPTQNLVTIAADGAETIDGLSSITLEGKYEGVTLRCDGTGWVIEALTGQSVSVSRVNIGATPGPKQLEFFNSGASRVGSGNSTIDKAALQDGLDSEYAVDIAGLKLQVEDTIAVTKPESLLMSSFLIPRNASGDAKRVGSIQVTDNELELLFDVQTYNTRWHGLQIECASANDTTTVFKCDRPDNYNDIDITIKKCSIEYGNKHVETFGRGLQFSDNEVVGANDSSIVLDWNPDWISNGQSNDQDYTAHRAYTITQIRSHGNNQLVRNTGTYRGRIANILMSDIQADTGGAIFQGVLNHSLINNAHCHYHAVAKDVYELWAGSKFSRVNNFTISGYKDGSVDRTPYRAIYLKPEDSPAMLDIVFSNGKIGPTNKEAVRIGGGGFCDVTFRDVAFIDAGINSGDAAPAFIYALAENSQTISDWRITLLNCRFRDIQAADPPSYIVGGNQNSLIKVYRDFATTQSGLSATWLAPSMTSLTD